MSAPVDQDLDGRTVARRAVEAAIWGMPSVDAMRQAFFRAGAHYIQCENPGADKQSNWLPPPAEAFNLTMRLHGAESPILDGSYRLPAVARLD